MRQFDVIEISRWPITHVVVLQHEAMGYRENVIVAPCVQAVLVHRPGTLTPTFELEGVAHAAIVGDLAAVSISALHGRVVANIADRRDSFTAAIDRLFTGI